MGNNLDYLPRTDFALKEFTTNFSTKITADPEAFTLTAAIATTLAGKLTSFDNALTLAVDPLTRTKATVFLKNEKRADLVAYIRELARQIQGAISVTDEQRIALQLPIRKTPAPIPVPDSSPVLEVRSVVGRVVKIRVHSAAGESSRAKPAGVAYANIFSFVGPDAPSDPTVYKFEGSTTRADAVVIFPNTVPSGSQVWLSAAWCNPRGQAGAGCNPVGFTLQGGPAVAAA